MNESIGILIKETMLRFDGIFLFIMALKGYKKLLLCLFSDLLFSARHLFTLVTIIYYRKYW